MSFGLRTSFGRAVAVERHRLLYEGVPSTKALTFSELLAREEGDRTYRNGWATLEPMGKAFFNPRAVVRISVRG